MAKAFKWAKQISGIGLENINGMASDAAGNVYVVGTFTGTIQFVGTTVETYTANNSDVWFAKYSSTGQYIWGKALVGGSHDLGRDIAVDNAGNVYITGSHGGTLDFNPSLRTTNNLTVPGGKDWSFIAKYTTDGNYLWAKNIGTSETGVSRGNGIAVEGNGTIYAVGDFSPQISFQSGTALFGNIQLNSANGNAYFAKLNSTNGDVIWAKNVGNSSTSTSPSSCEDVTITVANNIYITGFFTGQNVDFNPHPNTTSFLQGSSSTTYIAKYNTSGDFLYATNSTGAPNPIGMTGMSVDNDIAGNAYLIMSNEQNINNSDIYIAKYNNSLGLLAAKIIPNPNTYDAGLSIDAEPEGGDFYISGYVNSTGTPIDFNNDSSNPITVTVQAGRNDIYFAKYNSTSTAITCQYAKVMGTNGVSENYGKAAIKSINNTLYLAGWFSSPTDFDPCFTGTTFTPNGFTDSYIASYIAEDGSPVLLGPNLACYGTTTATFTIPNLSPNATVVWSQSSNLVTVSGQGTATYTVAPSTSTTSGPGSVIATVSGPCGFTLTKQFWVGLPSITYHPPGVNPCTDNPYYEGPIGSGLNYSWSIDNPNVWFTTGTTLINAAVISYNPEYFTITLTISDGQCSTAISLFGYTPGYYCQCFSDPSCGGGFLMSISPNPGNDILKVTLRDEPNHKTVITLLDDKGYPVRTISVIKKETLIDISNLKKGIYFLSLETGDKKEITRVVIDH